VNAPPEVVALAEARAQARARKDFTEADRLRDQIAAAGFTVLDRPDGFDLEPIVEAEPEPAARLDPRSVPDVLDEPATFEASVHWVCEGWPADIERAIAAFRAHAGDRSLQFVVADVTGEGADRWGSDIEVLDLAKGTGWAAARNAGLRRSLGSTVLAMDASVEPAGDVLGPLIDALADPGVGIVGPFGIVTRDLQQFEEAPGPGPCDAVEGYLMAFRREVLRSVGGFDEKFRWYRTADIEWSFRVKDAGLRCEVVDVPVIKHDHRMWFETDPAHRASWSKRNFYRFLDRFRDRWDLVLSGEPERPDQEQDGPVTLPEGR
jgi:cysteinyl-tRNA synthetase